MQTCSLVVGNRLVLRSERGVPEAEYALFDEGEIELHATSTGGSREVAYRTTVARARERLASFGVTAPFAEATAVLVPLDVKEAYARGAASRRIAEYLGAAELFEGARFVAGDGVYTGGWLDLRALAADVDVAGAGCALQALHLAALLAECDPSAPVTLSTADITSDARAGERTYRRVSLEHALALPEALRALPLPARDAASRRADGPAVAELLENVRGRMALAPNAATQARLMLVERGLLMRERPSRGPLADPELWALERKLTIGHAAGVLERVAAIERDRGRQPATAYLRARAALLAGAEEPRAIAARVSALAQAMQSFSELELLAAQAWAAAGDLKQALAFARLVADDHAAQDDLRAVAVDLAADAAAGRTPNLSAFADRIAPERAEALITSRPARSRRPVDGAPGTRRPPAASVPATDGASLYDGGRDPRDFVIPPMRVPRELEAAPHDAAAAAHATHADADEPVEHLPMPRGLERYAIAISGDAASALPKTPSDARVAFTQLARALAHDYRERYSYELRTNAAGIGFMQRELGERFPVGVESAEDALDVRRYGAFFSEVIARTLGASWHDIAPSEIGYWVMMVSPSIRVLPFGRVSLRIATGSPRHDLVAIYADLCARARRGSA